MNPSNGPEPLRPGLMASPRLIFGLPFGAGVVLHVMTGSDIQPGEHLIPVIAGAVFVAIGLILSGWATIALRRGGQHPDPARPTTSLVTDGPYEYSRNPIYLSFAALGLGIGLLLNSWWVVAPVPVALIALHFLVVVREERYMETVIGHQYIGYRESVRRWL
ncbi:MAG: isoprenylcysteine carboxylmethyltransferase family protein [Chloroflexi bacterium]|nr:isoprenylcysteine carboxylmethyltransferase family protein [Chloroflexota bacterium]MBT4072316.1 isoprenylcysteine carboxylmethyltransferase family protein [Chloroflexota bacterium]MBT4513863.1 isoprenylcysteine carboxylmethyltransferase family protein [Chloroflexota bacterium]MBT6680870.1 isoprenylcysteine carboxylmethyltransferase family protein [Chloroflexota bacterium]